MIEQKNEWLVVVWNDGILNGSLQQKKRLRGIFYR